MKRTSVVIGFCCVLLLASCAKQRVRREATIGNEILQVSMPAGKEVIHPQHGKEVWFGLGAMGGNGTTKANGVTQSHVFADGTTIVTVNLNIQPALKGSRFVAWLAKTGSKERVRLDVLQNPLNDVRHVITTELDKDLRAYTDVLVTLEKQSGPDDADPVQSKGLLKEVER